MSSRPFQPISTLLVKLVEALIHSEPEPDIKIQKRLTWIYKNTHERVNEHLSLVELAVFKNLDKGLNREIDIGIDKTFYLVELYKYLDEIAKELTQIVIEISKKYSLDIPLQSYQGMKQTIDLSEIK
jgi:hypothetical protein